MRRWMRLRAGSNGKSSYGRSTREGHLGIRGVPRRVSRAARGFSRIILRHRRGRLAVRDVGDSQGLKPALWEGFAAAIRLVSAARSGQASGNLPATETSGMPVIRPQRQPVMSNNQPQKRHLRGRQHRYERHRSRLLAAETRHHRDLTSGFCNASFGLSR